MNIPTTEEIEQLWDEWHVPPIIREHQRAVTKVALFLAKKLKEKGIHVDAGLVERSALLHDLARAANFKSFDNRTEDADDIEFWKQLKHKYPDTHHGDIAAEILKEKYPEVAETIKSHTTESQSAGISSWTWEMKVLTYADARVLHDKIVSREERDKDGDIRGKNYYDRLKKETGIDFKAKIRASIKQIESEIFEKLEITPEDVKDID